jgi:hypothetical protein
MVRISQPRKAQKIEVRTFEGRLRTVQVQASMYTLLLGDSVRVCRLETMENLGHTGKRGKTYYYNDPARS